MPFMDKFNKTDSAVFIFRRLYFQRIPLSDNFKITTSVVVPCGGLKSLPVHRFSDVIVHRFSVVIVHRFSVVIFTFSCLKGLGFKPFSEKSSAQPGARWREDVANAIIFHEQTNKTKSAVFIFKMLCFKAHPYQNICLNYL